MGSVRTEIVIERPLAEVFAFVSDLRHDTQWYQGIESVRVLSDVETGLGSVYEQQTRMFGRSFVAILEVTEFDPPRHMVVESRVSMIPFTAVYRFEPVVRGASTRYTLDAQVSNAGVFRLLGPVLAPMLRRATARRMTVLKRQLETPT